MKINLLSNIFIILLILFIFSPSSQSQTQNLQSKNPKLLVYYFHSTHRCPTCLSIEENTKATLEKYFAKELKSGLIIFKTINVDDKANEKIAKKYDAFGSALYLTIVKDGKEQSEDLTNFAFKYSRTKPDYYIEELSKKIKNKIN